MQTTQITNFIDDNLTLLLCFGRQNGTWVCMILAYVLYEVIWYHQQDAGVCWIILIYVYFKYYCPHTC